MKIKYRGRQKGFRIYLRKGAIQIDIGGKSLKKGYRVFQVSAWDEHKQGFIYLESYVVDRKSHVVTGIDYYNDGNMDHEELLYVSPKMIDEGCNNKMTCNALKKYQTVKR
jgi:hypothetical protein